MGKGAEGALFLLWVSNGWKIMARREAAAGLLFFIAPLFLLRTDKKALVGRLGHVWESGFI